MERQRPSELGGGDRRDFAGMFAEGSKASKRAGAISLRRATHFPAGTRGVMVLRTRLVHVKIRIWRVGGGSVAGRFRVDRVLDTTFSDVC